MKELLLEVFHIFFGSGIYSLARYYLELETLPLGALASFAIAGILLCAYGFNELHDTICKIVKERRNGQSGK